MTINNNVRPRNERLVWACKNVKSRNFATRLDNCRNVRGLGKRMVVFRLFEKLRYSNERSTILDSPYLEKRCLDEESGKIVALQVSPKIESFYGLGRQATKL